MTKDSPVPSPMQGAKRFRPPNINLTLAAERRGPPIVLEPESPVNLQLSDDDDDDDVFHDTLQLSSDESSPELSPSIPTVRIGLSDAVQDDISKDLAELEQLRNSVKKNLRLRPIRSRSDLPKVDLGKLDGPHVPPIPKSPMLASISSSSSTSTLRDTEPQSAISPTSSIASSYFTPINETPNSARFIGPSKTTEAPTSHFAPPTTNTPSPIPPKTLYDRLLSARRPLLIDTRPPATHLSFHIRHSINIAIPSLILKRCRKPGGGFQTLDALRQFITTEQGKEGWDELMHPGGPWDGDVVIYDDEMNPKDKDNVGVTAWALIPVLAPLLSYGTVDYLEGGISAGGHNPDLETLIVSGDESDLKFNDEATTQQGAPSQAQGGGAGGGLKKSGGLFQLDTQTAFRSKKLPEIEPSSSTASNPPTPPAARSPLPMMPSAMSSSRTNLPSPDPSSINIMDPTPSPPPSTIAFRRPPPPRRPSAPNLRKLDTKSTERLGANLPKLSLRTKPMRSATLTIPPSLSLQAPTSPSHLNLMYSNHSPPASARWTPTSPSISDPMNYLTPYFTPPHTPGTPKPFLPPSPSTPHTARPDLDPPTTDTEEGAFPVFTVSTILPNFLYLGPELTTPEHVQELQELGVKRILNIAAECDDDNGLKLKEVFERYVKIPMRDTVEEENIARGVREVCEILDDARLHSAPTYVHCKAGKSRSVTAVMAYLIHVNHWTLSRAYSFVLERRKGISPNIGFVSELMTFEEQELGGKSVGVQPSAPAGTSQNEGGGGNGQGDYAVAVGGDRHRRGGHVRESLPPALGGLEGLSGTPGPMSAGGLMDRVIGDSGQEMEIKDKEGRYRHARRAPVDENTLQPMRRVSKAGLESSSYA